MSFSQDQDQERELGRAHHDGTEVLLWALRRLFGEVEERGEKRCLQMQFLV